MASRSMGAGRKRANLLALLGLSSEVELHRFPELFYGLRRRPNEAPTLYPVACSPQAVGSGGAPFFILEGCLGVSVQAHRGRIVFDRPLLPEGIPQLSIRGLRYGQVVADLLLEPKKRLCPRPPRKPATRNRDRNHCFVRGTVPSFGYFLNLLKSLV